jgi:hypothetical protein
VPRHFDGGTCNNDTKKDRFQEGQRAMAEGVGFLAWGKRKASTWRFRSRFERTPNQKTFVSILPVPISLQISPWYSILIIRHAEQDIGTGCGGWQPCERRNQLVGQKTKNPFFVASA